MKRIVSGQKLFAGMIGVAMLGGVFAAGLHETQSVRLALAGTANGWPAGACQQLNPVDSGLGGDRPELVCWSNDFALSVPEPGMR